MPGDENDIHQQFLNGMKERANSFMDDGGGSDGSTADDVIDSGRQALRTGRDAFRHGKKTAQVGKKVGKAGGNAVRMGAKAASTAAKAGGRSAAAVVANVAGAKVKGGVIAAIVAGFLLLILIFSLMSVPNAIFDTVEDMMESWDTIKYTDEYEGNGLLNVLDFIGTTTGDLVKKAGHALKDAVTGLWDKLTGKDNDNASPDDINTVSEELIARLSVIKKALGANNKYRTRAKQIVEGISDRNSRINKVLYEMIEKMYQGNSSQEHDSTGEEGRIWYSPIIKSKTTPLGTDKDSYPTSDDVVDHLQKVCDKAVDAKSIEELEACKEEFNELVNDEFPQITDDGCNNQEALAYEYLASIQLGGSVKEMKISDFMKYMGYTGSGSTTFDIGHITTGKWQIEGTVPAWKGSFKPQYLMEEQKHYQNELVLAEANGENEREAQLKTTVDQYKDDGAPLTDLIVALDFPNLNIESLNVVSATHNTYTTGYKNRDLRTDHKYVFENPDGEDGKLTLLEWDITYNYQSPIASYTRHYRQFTIEYFITPRTSPEVMSLVGLYDGLFTEYD